LASAKAAVKAEPFAASPRLQEAVVREAAGDLTGAAEAASRATELEETNWRTWLVRARIAAELGRANDAVIYYRRAKGLNPRSPVFHE
jgi:Flp pilus assembly protein TadD